MNYTTTIQDIINKSLPKQSNIFDAVVQEIELFVNKPIHSIADIKSQALNKKIKGDLWESVCYLYLQNYMNHKVWFYKDFPHKETMNLPKADYGIDLISACNNQYYAIQCKYRKPSDKTQIIPWKSLSTFYGQVYKTGPWEKYITMTNVNGCRHIGTKTDKDWSICIGKFRSLKHFDWLKFVETSSNKSIESKPIERQLSTEEVRLKRLLHFGK